MTVMSLRARVQEALPVTAPLVLNPLMGRRVEAVGLGAGCLGGGATGYQSRVEHERLGGIDIEKLLAVERATVEKGKGA